MLCRLWFSRFSFSVATGIVKALFIQYCAALRTTQAARSLRQLPLSLFLSSNSVSLASSMQYEDSTGCLWTEEEDAEGYVYYVNANTMVSIPASMYTTSSELESSWSHMYV